MAASKLQAKNESGAFRLPTNVKPTHYAITIKTDLEGLTFDGFAEIDIDIVSQTESISFNVNSPLCLKGGELISTALKTENVQKFGEGEIGVDSQAERATINLLGGSKLEAGSKAKLRLSWSGELTSAMMGYYKSTYEHEGKKGNYSLTQFEPTAARRAFPCWDEPAIKATFDVTLITRKDTVALANTPSVSELPLEETKDEELAKTKLIKTVLQDGKGEWKVTKFARTPVMSTYLVAWANGNFKNVEGSFTSPLTGKTVPLRIYTTPEHIHQAEWALECTAKVLPVYERIFDVAYPLPKLDTLVASDFDAGAMENWGLITGRASIYLYDPKKCGLQAMKTTAEVQSHEIAHQWFGNICTMEWWEQLWLNEAFATLMGELIIIDRVWPEWKPNSDFTVQHLNRALVEDAKRSSHPIEVPCPDANRINEIFDGISYSKGASVLRMLSSMIGEDVFLKGVSIYLKKFLYSNATTMDLWDGISEASGLDIKSIMAEWTLKIGFPIITVTECDKGLHIRQDRFLSTGDPTPEENETIWHVPLALKTVKDGKPVVNRELILKDRETFVELPNAKTAVYKLNAETNGVYRVKYSPERLALLGEEANKKDSAFTLDDRIGLVSDAMVLAKSGYLSTSSALNLISKLKNEDSHLVWATIASNVADISAVWWEQPQELLDAFDKFRQDLFGPLADKLGFEGAKNDSVDLREMRTRAIASAAAASHPATIEEIKRRFNLFVTQKDDSLIIPDLQSIIFQQAVKHGGETEWEKILEVYRSPLTPQHQTAAMTALTQTRNPELIKRTKELMLKEVKEQDQAYFFAGLASNPMGRRPVWEFLEENYEDLIKRFDGNFSLGRLIQRSFSSLTKEEDALAVEKFFKEKDTAKYFQALSQGLETVRANAAWLKRDREDVERWLKANKYL